MSCEFDSHVVRRSKLCRKVMSRSLVNRLAKVVREWPADPSRKGRDLGEFLKKSYLSNFKELQQNPANAQQAVDSLEKLHSNHYKRLYQREKEYAYSGELAVKNPWVLSNESLSEMQQKSQSLWERLTGRNKS